MESLRSIGKSLELAPTSAPQSSGSVSLLRPSETRLSAVTEDALALLLAQTVARYPKQKLLPLTTDMYLAEWEEMVLRYGLDPFRNALSKAIRDRERAPFFPEPHDIEAHLLATIRAEEMAVRVEREQRESRRHLEAFDEMKARWLRERAEDIANGIARGSGKPAA